MSAQAPFESRIGELADVPNCLRQAPPDRPSPRHMAGGEPAQHARR